MLLVYVCLSIALPQVLSYAYRLLSKVNKGHSNKSRTYQTAGPSYPHITGLLGLDFLVENALNIWNYRFAEGVRQRFNSYGTTHTARLLHRRMVNTIDPENLQAVMKTNFDDYTIIPGREKLMRVLFGVGVFGTEGHEWKHSRKLVRTAMSALQLDKNMFEKHFEAMMGKIRSSNDDQSELDFGKVAFDYTLATATDSIIGGAMDSENEGDAQRADFHADVKQFGKDFSVLGKMARVLTIMISQIPYLTNIVYWSTYRPTQNRVFEYVDARIRRAHQQQQEEQEQSDPISEASSDDDSEDKWYAQSASSSTSSLPTSASSSTSSLPILNNPKKNCLSTLLPALASQTTDTTRIRSEALHLLLAGHDTVGIALSELFWCLSRTPSAWSRLRAEVLSHPSLSSPSFDLPELKKLPYLNHVINEAIRIRPTLSVHGRRAVRDTVLPRGGGALGDEPLFVSSGTYIVYSNYALYRNPAVFGDDVDAFRPERWEEGVKPARYEFLNFGAGPRYCPGRELGWSMLAYVTVRLAQCVETLEPVDDDVWQEARAFSFHNRNGVKLRMVPAESESESLSETVHAAVTIAGEA